MLIKNYFSYLSTKTFCGYSKKPSQEDGSFEQTKTYMFKPILSAILVTVATGKSKINARILHLSYFSNEALFKIKLVKSNFQFLALEGAKIAPKFTYPFRHQKFVNQSNS